VSTITAACLLVTAGDNPERLRSEAAFAHLCGVAPIPASSGKTTRHRLNRGGDREANKAPYLLAAVRPSDVGYLNKLGQGNLSVGLRRLIDEARTHSARPITQP
jgi:transposase